MHSCRNIAQDNQSNGGLLKSENHAQREGFWAAHVLRPRGAQSQGVAPECRLSRLNKVPVRRTAAPPEVRECAGSGLRMTAPVRLQDRLAKWPPARAHGRHAKRT